MASTINSKVRRRNSTVRRGSAMLVVLVSIVIGMLIYFLTIKTIFGPSLGGGSILPASRPWLQEDRILADDQIVEMPESPKVEINKKFSLRGPVVREGKSRGAIEITFDTDGRVAGVWSCAYSHGGQGYSYDAGFRGNVDVDIAYELDGKKDKSLLYFIAKGEYVQKSTNVESGVAATEKGTVYVTGYLAGDRSAKGVITITTDRKWSAVYDWRTEAGDFPVDE